MILSHLPPARPSCPVMLSVFAGDSIWCSVWRTQCDFCYSCIWPWLDVKFIGELLQGH